MTAKKIGLISQNIKNRETAMSDDPMLKALEAEERKLMAELERTPAFRRLKLAQKMIEEYRDNPAARPDDLAPVPEVVERLTNEFSAKPGTKTAQVEAAAVEYLTKKGRRATSGELLPAVIAKGIEVTGKTPSKTLSSYLSTSKRFDNVPGFGGYGLVEWNGRRTAPIGIGSGGNDPERSATANGQLPLNS